VLCPTRELAAQVAENFDTYSKYLKLSKALLIGGVSFKEQDKLIDKGVDVLIATPGRLLDHHERGKLILTDVKVMVVDEADRMLDMGFIPDIERIFGLTPFTRQTLFFSATMAPEIERITNTFLSNPERIEVARQATTSENITQGVVMFRASKKDREATEKRALLRALIDAEGDKCTNAIIFCNRKMDVDAVASSLKKHGYDAAPIHGDLEQSQRTRTLDGFRAGTLRFLIASDVAARGLDVPAVSHVFNFDVPSHAEDYVHRIGRTGRAGRDGKAIMICTTRDEKNLEDVERLVQKAIPRSENPLGSNASAEERAKPREEASSDDKPKRSRSRSRKSSDAPKPDAVAAGTPAQATAQSASDTDLDTLPLAPAPRREPPKANSRAMQAPSGEAQPEEAKADPAAETPQERPVSPRARNDRSERPERQERSERPERNERAERNDRPERSDRNDRNRSNDSNDNRVVGLGDHTPSFIELSFADRPKD
jgi:superfamily II DNA/RNA helicase